MGPGRIRRASAVARSSLTALAAAVAIMALAILPLLSPQWVAFEQGRAGAQQRTGYTGTQLQAATGAILHDLVAGGDFSVQINGQPVLNERERVHMADVRDALRGFAALALACIGGLLLVAWRDRARLQLALVRAAAGLLAGVLGVGLLCVISFGLAFELFHRLLFPAGSYTFDVATDRLVQLFPTRFWSDTALAAAGLVIGLSAASLTLGWVMRRRSRSLA